MREVAVGSDEMEKEIEKATAAGKCLKIIFKPAFNKHTEEALDTLSDMEITGRVKFPLETDLQRMSAARLTGKWVDKSEKARSCIIQPHRLTFKPKVFMLGIEPAIQGVLLVSCA